MFGFLASRKPPPVERQLPQPPDRYADLLFHHLYPTYHFLRELADERLLVMDEQERRFVVQFGRMDEGEGQKRFLRLTRPLLDLNHPGIIPLLGAFATGGWAWTIRPWVQGRLLGKYLAQTRLLSWPEVREYLVQLLDALDYAHGLGFVHRALSDAAVWLSEGRVLLGNFGETAWHDPHRAVAGSLDFRPNPIYMAPETITGGEVGPAADYFSLGTLLFQMLSGRVPFEADEPIAVLMKVLSEKPPRLDTLVSDLPHGVAEMVDALLEKEPAKRLQRPEEIFRPLSVPPPKAPQNLEGELGDYVDKLQLEGERLTRDSAFTLDRARALEKLRTFQFSETDGYLLSLAAAGCALGCSYLYLETVSGGLKLSYHGLKEAVNLQDLLSYAFAPTEPARSHLALGVASILARPQTTVSICSQGRGFRYASLDKWEPISSPSGALSVRIDSPQLRFSTQFLSSRLRHAPMKVAFNDRTLVEPVYPNRPAFQFEGKSYALSFVPGPVRNWDAVVDGLSFYLPPGPHPSGRVLVWGPLPVDLSFRHLVQNESLRDFSLCVQNEVDRALADGALTNELGGQSDLYERALELWKVRDESVYWRLLSRSAFLRIRKPEWSFLEQIARQVFDLPEEALLWRLKVWLDWGLCRPDSEQRGELRRLAQLHGLPGAYQERLLRSESAAQEVAHNGTGMD